VNLPASGIAGPLGAGSFTIGRLGRFNLDLRLSAGESTGETKLISTPRITTLDNKEALIQQGESIPFETVSQSGTQTQFVDATLNLTVTPHITPDGSVSMKIKATKNAIGTFRSSITGTPSIDKREAHTEILVKDGETAVIGGIFESTQDHSIAGVPWFYKVPVLGWFFKRDSRSDNRRELLIFITPTIVKVQPST
jgi:type IV pilus assembly protein PilQ